MIKLLYILICALLYRVGGWKWKPARRFILPAIIALWTGHWLAFPIGAIAFSLPVTLKGSDITSSWTNRLWIPVLGFLIGLQTLHIIPSLVYSIIFTTIVALSNHKKTAEIFKWQYCEIAFGALLGILT